MNEVGLPAAPLSLDWKPTFISRAADAIREQTGEHMYSSPIVPNFRRSPEFPLTPGNYISAIPAVPFAQRVQSSPAIHRNIHDAFVGVPERADSFFVVTIGVLDCQDVHFGQESEDASCLLAWERIGK